MENKLQNIRITILLNEVEKLLGIAINENDNIKLINLINMVIKQIIYTCRCLNKRPSGQVVMEKIKEIWNIERVLQLKMIILKSITTNGICFTLCRNVGVLMEKVQSV